MNEINYINTKYKEENHFMILVKVHWLLVFFFAFYFYFKNNTKTIQSFQKLSCPNTLSDKLL